MLEKLSQSKSFKKDIIFFKNAIDKIENITVKRKAQDLLDKLIREVSIIDSTHSVLSGIDLDPKKVRENVENISYFRGELKNLVKDINYF